MMFLAQLPVRQENHGNKFNNVILLSIEMLELEAETTHKKYLNNLRRLVIKKKLLQETVPLQIVHQFKINLMIFQLIRVYLIMKVSKIYVVKNRLWCALFMVGQLDLGIMRQRLNSFTYRTLKTINFCLQNLQAILKLLAK